MSLNLEVQLYLSMPSFCRPLHYVNNAISQQKINFLDQIEAKFEPPCQKLHNPDDHITYLYLLHLQINELGHIFSTSADFSRLAKNSVKVDNVKHMVNDIIYFLFIQIKQGLLNQMDRTLTACAKFESSNLGLILGTQITPQGQIFWTIIFNHQKIQVKIYLMRGQT